MILIGFCLFSCQKRQFFDNFSGSKIARFSLSFTSSDSVIRWLNPVIPVTGTICCTMLYGYTQDMAFYFLFANIYARNCGVNGQETLRRQTFLRLHDGRSQQVFAHLLRSRHGVPELVARNRLTVLIPTAVRANGFFPCTSLSSKIS